MSAYKLLIIAIIVVVLFGIVLILARLFESFQLEKRYNKYSLDPFKTNELSVFDKVLKYYEILKERLALGFKKSYFLRDYSKRYEKYLNKVDQKKSYAMNYISAKFIWGVIFIILLFISSIFQYRLPEFVYIILAFLIGFFVPDIYWIYLEKVRKKEIQKDMLKAIIIMNNSFKSGLSIMQAIYMVSNELDGPIAQEFKKMYIDISFGLDMDLVFKRFSKRINTEEAHYITTSLSVLNKTGGNIVQVFSSVERNAFTRKKLESELNALSASAVAIYRLLVAVPIILIAIIMLLNPAYFMPLFTNSIGRMILITILAMYISYILIIRKIVRG